MKPIRGSARDSSKPPTEKNTGKKKTQKHKRHNAETAQDSEPGPSALKSTKKKKKEGDAPSAPRKTTTGQKQWKPMPASSVSALDNILETSILSALSSKKTGVTEVQKHLNLVKNRFLAECKQLKVPIQKPSDFWCSSRQRQEQTKTSSANKRDLSSLESSLQTVVSSLETLEEQKVSLDHRCSILMDQLEDEEEKAEEIFHVPEQGILALPSLPTLKPSEATFQEQTMRIIPNAERGTTARRLGGILQKSAQLQDVQALLFHAHKHADQLKLINDR